MTVDPDGFIDVVIGVSSQGQGHETSFAQLVGEWFDVLIERVRLLTDDTDMIKFGGGAHSGRGMWLPSLIIWKASNGIIATGKRVAALLLQGRPEAVDFGGGRFTVRGTGQAIGLFEVSAAMLRRADLPEELRAVDFTQIRRCSDVARPPPPPCGLSPSPASWGRIRKCPTRIDR